MRRIAILADNEALGSQLAGWTRQFWAEHGQFPHVEQHQVPERFYSALEGGVPCGVIVALPGVAGLNAAEHLRSLCPNCGLIWCSDLDFSLHAYRLRAEYFILNPATDEELCKGLSLWREKMEAREMTAR